MKQINIDDAIFDFLEEAVLNVNTFMKEEFTAQDLVESYIVQLLAEEVDVSENGVPWATPAILKAYKDYINSEDSEDEVIEQPKDTIVAPQVVEDSQKPKDLPTPKENEKEESGGFFGSLFGDKKDEEKSS